MWGENINVQTLTELQDSWKLYIEEYLRSGAEEYFNKKKTLIEKCSGVVRGQSSRTTHPNCVESNIPHNRIVLWEVTR